MKNTFLLFFFCLGLMACSQPEGKKVGKVEEVGEVEKVENGSTLFDLKNVHRFSDSTQMDTLRLQVTGDDLLQGNAQLTITRFDGKVIYQQFFRYRNCSAAKLFPWIKSSVPFLISNEKAS